MATVPLAAPVPAAPLCRRKKPAPGQTFFVVLAVGLSLLGVLSIWPTALSLWSLWTTDPLKSIGALVPAVSLLLILRAWRALRWEQEGNAGALFLLAAIALVVHLRDGAVFVLVLSPSWALTLPPHSLVAFGYVSGVVLLFGGTRLWRAARFPIALTLLVNPVPHVFSRAVDLPLQHASATVARGLAHALGQHLTPDQLSLMFTPQFGMFIAPGCDGIRGAVAMGLLALIAGYLYRFRLPAWLALVAGGVALGYVFNLLRLCGLVVYYIVALPWPWLQRHAEGADYCIGATLFFAASLLLCSGVRRFAPGGTLRIPPLSREPLDARARTGIQATLRPTLLRSVAFALLILFAYLPYARGDHRGRPHDEAPVFPALVGTFQLQKTWTEKLVSGQTIFFWASYRDPARDRTVALGISPVLGAHDTLLCHTARGEDWVWHGSLSLPSHDGPVAFSAAQFAQGAVQSLEASTLCSAKGCGQWTSTRTHLGLMFSRPDPAALLGAGPGRPVPVLLQTEQNASLSPAQARGELVYTLEQFTQATSFGAFTYRYLRP